MILLDYRGHGESRKTFPGNVYDYDLIVSDIISFLDTLGHIPLHVIGVSQGAILATLVAIHHPSYVKNWSFLIAIVNSQLKLLNGYFNFPISSLVCCPIQQLLI